MVTSDFRRRRVNRLKWTGATGQPGDHLWRSRLLVLEMPEKRDIPPLADSASDSDEFGTDAPMHIAMLSAEYPPRWGGMGSTVFHLSAALAAVGHSVTVITRDRGFGRKAGKSIPRTAGVDVIEVGWLPIPMAFTRSYGRRALSALRRLHAKNPVDAVHIHAPMISWTLGQYNRVREQIAPVTTSLHGSWLGERDGMRLAARYGESAAWANPNDIAILLTGGHYARYERAAVRGSTVCVANSEATKRDFLARYDPPQDWNCEVVRWGVDIDMFKPLHIDHEESMLAHEKMRLRYGKPDDAALNGDIATTTPLLLAVGRLVGRKGFLTLLRAMPEVIEANPSAHLVCVGRGHMHRRLLNQARRLGIGDSVTFEASLEFTDLAQLFRSADLVAYPSYYEGQGLIPLEAMASGTPVVTVNDGPLPEMVDESVGALFPLGDAGELAAAVNRLLVEPEMREKLARNGRRRVISEYTYDLNAERYVSLYRRK
jgi:glycosyltransferase involved in cell wall biosynthesis